MISNTDCTKFKSNVPIQMTQFDSKVTQTFFEVNSYWTERIVLQFSTVSHTLMFDHIMLCFFFCFV